MIAEYNDQTFLGTEIITTLNALTMGYHVVLFYFFNLMNLYSCDNNSSTYLGSNITYIEIRHKIVYLFNAFYHGRCGDEVDRHMKYVKFHFYDLLYAHIF